MNDKVIRAALRITTWKESTTFISDALGIDNSGGHVKGDPKSSHQDLGVYAESTWILDSPLEDSADLSSHVEFIVGLLESRAPQWGAIRHLTGLADIFCMFSSENGQVSTLLRAGLIERLAKQKLDLILDLFPPEA